MKMHAPAGEQVRQKNHIAAPSAPSIAESDSTFTDARPEVTTLQHIQAMVANSPRNTQLKSIQAMMANSDVAAAQKRTAAIMTAKPFQRVEDDEPLRGEFETEPAQLEAVGKTANSNNTGLPHDLKSGIENHSGMSMGHVKVHYNSGKPAQLQAHAYAQGSEIHVAPGQEKHLPHEAWHVVQQQQGRVKPTMQLKGKVDINHDAGLEREADQMGAIALSAQSQPPQADAFPMVKNDSDQSEAIFQLKPARVAVPGTTHVVKVINESIFEGQEVPPPFGQVQNNEELFIDNEDIFTSRRGPNQEVENNRNADALRLPDQDWYKVLKLKGEKVGDRDYYLREETFIPVEGPSVDENLDSVEDLLDLLENALPAWANIHRAMAMEAEEFYGLQEAQKSEDSQAQRKTVHLYGNDQDSTGIADLSNIKTGGEKDLSLHLGSARMESYARQDYLRVYLAMVTPQTSRRDEEDGPRYTTYKDTHQDDTGEILIYGTQKSGSPDTRRSEGQSSHDTMFFNIGKPLRAFAWAKKYQAQHPEFAKPVVRSFLVPLLPTLGLMFGASTEHDKSQGNPNFPNVDMDRLGNQFAAGGSALSALEKLAVRASMISYSDDLSSFDKSSGAVLSLSALAGETGVPDKALKSALLTDDKSFRSTYIGKNITDIKQQKLALQSFMPRASETARIQAAEGIARTALEGAIAKRPSSMVADELQVVYASWKGNPSLLPEAVAMPDNRQAVVSGFLKKEGYSEALIDLLFQRKMQ